MSRSTVIALIAVSTSQDANGVWRESESAHRVFAKVDSVSASEFFEGGRNGLNPSLRFLIFSGDYHGEPIVEHEGLRYGVYRTYEHGDQTEVYVERKGGTNGTSNAD